jgi:transposase
MWPGIVEQEEEPHECDQHQLVEKKMRHHGNAPSDGGEMRALYRVFALSELSAGLRDTTSRQGAVVIQATRDFTVQTVQKAADLAVKTGSRLYTDSASSYRAVKGYVHEFVNHTKKEYARGEVHENRAECLFSLLKPYLRVFRGVSKFNLPGYVGFFQFLRNFRQRNAFEQAELILQAALDPVIASRAKKGEFVKCFDHFDLLQTAIN